MSSRLQGVPASPGIVIGRAFVFRWPDLKVAHATVPNDGVETEARRFIEACEKARERTRALRSEVAGRLGPVQAKIFDPQLLMLEDPELVDATLTYIRDSSLTAERAFYLRILEFRSQWLDATHARVMDRIADLTDIETRVVCALTDSPHNDLRIDLPDDEPVILVAHEFTPSRTMELDPNRVLALATDAGTRTSHSSILARSLGIPAVVGLGDLAENIHTGAELILDGYRGRVVIEPSEAEKGAFHDRDLEVRETESELAELASVEPVTVDGVRIELHANLEFPTDAELALAAGADGVGLFRTEFLVVGVSEVPKEEEQFAAFRTVVEAFDPRPVVIRTYDFGGDKYPMFMPRLVEENPFLGWRGIRIYEVMPELFHNQVRAVLRAAALGDVRMLLPMVNSVDEVEAVRRVIERVERELAAEGVEHSRCQLGVMLETPAAIAITEVLGRHVDFFSLGTNDLAQYVLAVDRGNAKLARFYDGYHPALLRFIRDAVAGAERSGRPLSVCGEAAADPVGATLLIGLGLRSLSCPPGEIPKMKKLIRTLEVAQLERAVQQLYSAETGAEVKRRWLRAVWNVDDSAAITVEDSFTRPD